MEKQIKEYFKKFNLSVKKSRDARFIDQKVTPDVLAFISDCILNYVCDDIKREFTVKDIWNSHYFLNNIKAFYNKPDAKGGDVSREYNKFIGQPLKTLSYAHILYCKRVGARDVYQIKNSDILEYISIKDRNAFNFLYIYLTKVLKDSKELGHFERFKNKNIKNEVTGGDYSDLKEKFRKFLWGHTNITAGKTNEPDRIFPKVLNIFAVYNNIRGSKGGFLSKNQFYFTDLMYNRINFRDIKKDKNISRQKAEVIESLQEESRQVRQDYLINKATNVIKKKYTVSEVDDDLAKGPATEVHHIFRKNEFPNIACYLENLIKLTASQHRTRAHHNGNYRAVNKEYQLVCLLAKSDSIEKSIKNGEFIYSKEALIYVINTGLSKNLDIKLSHRDIKVKLSEIYNES